MNKKRNLLESMFGEAAGEREGVPNMPSKIINGQEILDRGENVSLQYGYGEGGNDKLSLSEVIKVFGKGTVYVEVCGDNESVLCGRHRTLIIKEEVSHLFISKLIAAVNRFKPSKMSMDKVPLDGKEGENVIKMTWTAV